MMRSRKSKIGFSRCPKKKMNRAKKDSLFAYAVGMVFILILVFMGTRPACAQGTGSPEYFKWRWSDQPVMQMPDASGLHFVGSAYLCGTLDNSMKWWEVDLQVLAYGALWECKDALIPWERAGFLGGEGFSWNDILMDVSGIVTHRLGVLIYNRIKYGYWNPNKINVRRRDFNH